MTLRTRIVLICVGVTAIAVAAAGLILVRSVSSDLRSSLDETLRDVGDNFTPQIVTGLVNESFNVERTAELLGGNPTRGSFQDRVVFELGDVPDAERSDAFGFDDVATGPDSWRRLTIPVRSGRNRATVEVFASLEPIDERIVFLRNRAVAVGGVAVLFSAVLGALLARAVTSPLKRLRNEANEIKTTDDLDRRLTPSPSSREIDEVTSVLNNMLDRLEVESGRTRQSLEAAKSFASDATHELRTPLTAVANNVEILQRHPELSADERAEILAEISERQQTVTRVLGTLRDLARGDLTNSSNREAVDLGEIADSAIAAAPTGGTAEINLLAEGNFVVNGWADGLRIMFDNLLSNALVHGRALDGRATVLVELTSDDGHVTVAVGDSGLGIDKADVERVQRRYERADSHAGGSGLGLALVRQQADLHAGRLSIARSKLGGAEVKVRLPRS